MTSAIGRLVIALGSLRLAASLVLAGELRGWLFGVASHNSATLASVILHAGAASLIAAWLPARRKARVELAPCEYASCRSKVIHRHFGFSK